MEKERTYLAVDLKSFFASVECVERHFDPLTANLVVADASGTEKTICLAATPSLKAYGISGRARLFKVVQQVKEVNAERLRKAGGHGPKGGQYPFTGSSFDANALADDPSLELFTDYAALEQQRIAEEKRLQKATLQLQKRYGKNAILKGMNLQEGATTMARNAQIGGHKAE